MKQPYIFFFVITLLVSCESKKTVEIKQIDSKEMVTILPNIERINDSVSICIPLEFEININSPIYYINWFYSENNKFLENGFDYLVYNKEDQTKFVYQLDFDESFNEKRIAIILKERNHLISKREALELLKKYNVSKSLDNLKPNDTIKLASYDRFKIDNKQVINDLNKISDSINFRAMKKDGSFFYLSKKIDW
jgi:hypothetical protein